MNTGAHSASTSATALKDGGSEAMQPHKVCHTLTPDEEEEDEVVKRDMFPMRSTTSLHCVTGGQNSGAAGLVALLIVLAVLVATSVASRRMSSSSDSPSCLDAKMLMTNKTCTRLFTGVSHSSLHVSKMGSPSCAVLARDVAVEVLRQTVPRMSQRRGRSASIVLSMLHRSSKSSSSSPPSRLKEKDEWAGGAVDLLPSSIFEPILSVPWSSGYEAYIHTCKQGRHELSIKALSRFK